MTSNLSSLKRCGIRIRGVIVFVSVSAIFPLMGFAQGAVTSQEQIDWLPIEAYLREAISSGNSERKRAALFDIRNHRTERASRLAIPALKDRDPIVRATAAASVVFLQNEDAVRALSPLLDDREPFVRREAAYALGNVGSSLASARLIQTFQRDRDIEVRAAAAMALGTTGDLLALEPLSAVLQSRPTEENEFLRRSAARSIGQLAESARGIRPSSLTPENFLPEKFKTASVQPADDPTSRSPVFDAAVTQLSRVLQNSVEADDTRREAAFALGAIGSRSSLSMLEIHRNSPDPYLAEICREALLKIENKE